MVNSQPYVPQKRKNDQYYHEDRWHGDHIYDDDDDDDYRERSRYYGKRRKSRTRDFLEDLFDIFD